jgi:hypothetical protein
MHRLAIGAAMASLLVLAATVPANAQAQPSPEPSTRTVEIPGAGAAVMVPRTWRTWQSEPDRLQRSVWTRDLVSGWTCQIWSSGDSPSAAAAADAFIEAPESAAIGASRSEPFEVPVGSAILVTLGSPDEDPPSRIQRLAFIDAPEGVVEIFCGPAPADHVVAVAESIEPLTPDYSPEPFDPRVELADHGFSVDFGPEWSVGSGSRVGYRTLLGGPVVLTAGREGTDAGVGDPPVEHCTIEDDSEVPGLTGLTSLADWKTAIRDAGKGMLHTVGPTMKVVGLTSGPAIRARWPFKLGPTTGWIVSDDEHVVVLLCWSDAPPGDGWRSIAETIEFLPEGG